MKQNIFNKLWLRVALIVAVVTTAFAGTVWAEDNTPITVELEGFTATSGQIDGNISFETTSGTVSGSNLTATTFTLTSANNAKINSVTFHWTSLWVNVNWQAIDTENDEVIVSGSFEANVSGSNTEQNPKVSDLNYKKIVFSSSSSLSFDYIKVTYTPETPPEHTITALSSDTNKGTVELDGNVIIATPKPGYGIDDTNPYTVTEGTATVVRTGNNFVVEPSTDCKVTINFVAHTGGLSLDFEHPLDTYTDWNVQGFEPYQWEISAYAGTYYGKVNANPAYIQTTAKVEFPGTFSCWVNTREPGSSYTWKVQVFSDDDENNSWEDVATKTITQKEWVQFTADLSLYTNVYVRLYYTGSGTNGAVDDIVLTTATATVPVSVADYGYSTFCCHRALDFTNSSITAYYVTTNGNKLTYNQITKVPANTGVLLHKAGGVTDEEVPALIGNPDDVSGNVLIPGSDETVITWTAEDKKYILYNHPTKGVGFFGANNSLVPSNRAYLYPSIVGNVKSFIIDLDDDATAIQTIESADEDSVIYNLAGQRLQKMQKGINIVNGKKILF